MRVDIIQFPQTAVAALTHQGLPERINDTAARFIQWRKATGGSPVATSRTYGLAPDDPATTEGAAFRFTLCGSVESPVAEDNEWGVKNALIPPWYATTAPTTSWPTVPGRSTATGCPPAAKSCGIFRSSSTTTTLYTRCPPMSWSPTSTCRWHSPAPDRGR